MEREILKKYFTLTDYNDNWKRFQKPYYYYTNRNYSGGETIEITTSAYKILKFIEELFNINPDLLNLIKEIRLNYWVGNEFRGSGSDESSLIIDKEFAQKIQLRGYFRWVDRAWGDYSSSLEYDLKKLV